MELAARTKRAYVTYSWSEDLVHGKSLSAHVESILADKGLSAYAWYGDEHKAKSHAAQHAAICKEIQNAEVFIFVAQDDTLTPGADLAYDFSASRQYLVYALIMGVPVVYVDARHTTRTLAQCGDASGVHDVIANEFVKGYCEAYGPRRVIVVPSLAEAVALTFEPVVAPWTRPPGEPTTLALANTKVYVTEDDSFLAGTCVTSSVEAGAGAFPALLSYVADCGAFVFVATDVTANLTQYAASRAWLAFALAMGRRVVLYDPLHMQRTAAQAGGREGAHRVVSNVYSLGSWAQFRVATTAEEVARLVTSPAFA
jgi:hypothetical protein